MGTATKQGALSLPGHFLTRIFLGADQPLCYHKTSHAVERCPKGTLASELEKFVKSVPHPQSRRLARAGGLGYSWPEAAGLPRLGPVGS